MITYTPQPNHWKPIRYGGADDPPDPSPVPQTLTLRECFTWRHTEGEPNFVCFFCYEAVPAGQYLCVKVRTFKQELFTSESTNFMVHRDLMQAINDGPILYPTLEQAMDSFDPSTGLRKTPPDA